VAAGPHRLVAELGLAEIGAIYVYNLDLTGTTATWATVIGPIFVSSVDSRCPDGLVPEANTCTLN
jgi:hypothetical protein